MAFNFTAKVECLAELTAYTEHKSTAALETMEPPARMLFF